LFAGTLDKENSEMNIEFSKGRPWVLMLLALALGLTAAATTHADRNERGSPRGRADVFDNRYHHDHYYPRHGARVHALPYGYRPYFHGGRPYYFYGGTWYSPVPGGFVVVGAPLGLNISTLPPYYTTLWFNGTPYYYADNTYYQWAPQTNDYAIVAPPPSADRPGAAPPPDSMPASAPEGFFLYPRNGQAPEQQAADRFECHTWSKGQTGFDPTQPGGGVSPTENGTKSTQYTRAMAACLEARGYSVK
jgi:hypothetical protein